MTQDKDHAFTNSILARLEAMNNVQALRDETGITSLVKEELKFGEILNAKLKLLNKEGKYNLVDSAIMADNDLLLKEATYSYWIACGKK
ncbi:MAG: hypothetical protein H6909_02860 [Rickettsiaceae bacterium]|nr:hypothetical protein [Rickettsiaceae bacterium]